MPSNQIFRACIFYHEVQIWCFDVLLVCVDKHHYIPFILVKGVDGQGANGKLMHKSTFVTLQAIVVFIFTCLIAHEHTSTFYQLCTIIELCACIKTFILFFHLCLGMPFFASQWILISINLCSLNCTWL